MVERRSQIKREQVVGNEVVLQDIKPLTDTFSIDDSRTGEKLQLTLEAMWSSINNSLSRITNSVNGRTGVVVLTKEDVGLGNVDNVSNDELMKWVEKRLMEEFGHKRFKLFNSLHEVAALCDENDMNNRDVAFLAKNGFNRDRKSWLGYIFYNPQSKKLEHTQMHINLSGWSDMSLRYDHEWENTSPNRNNTGRLGVNIWRHETALEVYNQIIDPDNADKNNGGLRLIPDAFAHQFFYFDGMYGTDEPGFPCAHALLGRNNEALNNRPLVEIFIDGIRIEGPVNDLRHGRRGWFRLKPTTRPTLNMPASVPNLGTPTLGDSTNPRAGDRTPRVPSQTTDNPPRPIPPTIDGVVWDPPFKVGDMIYTRFRDYPTNDPLPRVRDSVNLHPALISRNAALGRVTLAPNIDNRDGIYRIDFWRIDTKLGFGLQRIRDHQNSGAQDMQTALRLVRGRVPVGETAHMNFSGLNVIKGAIDADVDNIRSASRVNDMYRWTVLPTGPIQTCLGNDDGGLFINPDTSLCIIPRRAFSPGNTNMIGNWNPTTRVPHNTNNLDVIQRNGALSDQSLIGINLMKTLDNDPNTTRVRLGNSSGLRVINDGTATDTSHYGLTSSSGYHWNDTRNDILYHPTRTGRVLRGQGNDSFGRNSGGLAININNTDSLLEIAVPGFTRTADNFNQGGVVRVRYNQDRGLIHAMNRLQLHINTSQGLEFKTGYNTNRPNNTTVNDIGQLQINIGNRNPTIGLLTALGGTYTASSRTFVVPVLKQTTSHNWIRLANGNWDIPNTNNFDSTINHITRRALFANGWTRSGTEWRPPSTWTIVETGSDAFRSFILPSDLRQGIVNERPFDTRRGLEFDNDGKLQVAVGRGLKFRTQNWDEWKTGLPHNGHQIDIDASKQFRFEDQCLYLNGLDNIDTSGEKMAVRHSPTQFTIRPENNITPRNSDWNLWTRRNVWNRGLTKILLNGSRGSNIWNPGTNRIGVSNGLAIRGWSRNPNPSFTAPEGYNPPQGNLSVSPPLTWRRTAVGAWYTVALENSALSNWDPPGYRRTADGSDWERTRLIPKPGDWDRNGAVGNSFSPYVPNTRSFLLATGWIQHADRTWEMPAPGSGSQFIGRTAAIENWTRNADGTFNITEEELVPPGWHRRSNGTYHPPGWEVHNDTTDGRVVPILTTWPSTNHPWFREPPAVDSAFRTLLGMPVAHRANGGNNTWIRNENGRWRIPSTERVGFVAQQGSEHHSPHKWETEHVNTLDGYGLRRSNISTDGGGWISNMGASAYDSWNAWTIEQTGSMAIGSHQHRVVARIPSLPSRYVGTALNPVPEINTTSRITLTDNININTNPTMSESGYVLLDNGRWLPPALNMNRDFPLPPGWDSSLENTWTLVDNNATEGPFRTRRWRKPVLFTPPTTSFGPWEFMGFFTRAHNDTNPHTGSINYTVGRWRAPISGSNQFLPSEQRCPCTGVCSNPSHIDHAFAWKMIQAGNSSTGAVWEEPIGYRWDWRELRSYPSNNPWTSINTTNHNDNQRIPLSWSLHSRTPSPNPGSTRFVEIWQEPWLWSPPAGGIPVRLNEAGRSPDDIALANPRVEWILPHPGIMKNRWNEEHAPVGHFLQQNDGRWLLPNTWNHTGPNGERDTSTRRINTNVAWPREKHGGSGVHNGTRAQFANGWYVSEHFGTHSGGNQPNGIVFVPPTDWTIDTPWDGYIPDINHPVPDSRWLLREVNRDTNGNTEGFMVNLGGSDSGGWGTPAFRPPAGYVFNWNATWTPRGTFDRQMMLEDRFHDNFPTLPGGNTIAESWNREVRTVDSRGLVDHTYVESTQTGRTMERSDPKKTLVPNLGNGLCLNVSSDGNNREFSSMQASRIGVNLGRGLDFSGDETSMFGRKVQIRLRRRGNFGAKTKWNDPSRDNTSGLEFDSTGALYVNFPNPPPPTNIIQRGMLYTIPGGGNTFTLSVPVPGTLQAGGFNSVGSGAIGATHTHIIEVGNGIHQTGPVRVHIRGPVFLFGASGSGLHLDENGLSVRRRDSADNALTITSDGLHVPKTEQLHRNMYFINLKYVPAGIDTDDRSWPNTAYSAMDLFFIIINGDDGHRMVNVTARITRRRTSEGGMFPLNTSSGDRRRFVTQKFTCTTTSEFQHLAGLLPSDIRHDEIRLRFPIMGALNAISGNANNGLPYPFWGGTNQAMNMVIYLRDANSDAHSGLHAILFNHTEGIELLADVGRVGNLEHGTTSQWSMRNGWSNLNV
jgi:hypothetical protein